LSLVHKNTMLPLYLDLVQNKLILADDKLIERMKVEIDAKLKELTDKITDATENYGENEIREANLNLAIYYKKIGDKEKSVESYEKTATKTIALGQKIDITFDLLRIAFAFSDLTLLKKYIEKAKVLVEEGGDWERRNRLKVYEATYLMWIRQFTRASKLFLDSISTFSCTEIMSFQQFIFYTVILSCNCLERPELKSKIIDSSEVYSVLRELPVAEGFLNSLYRCNYAQFLSSLAEISDSLKMDRYFEKHVNFYVREVRILAYTQFLESYKSIKMQNMATQFGVSFDFLDRELSRFIASGRLHAKIDKVGQIIETTRLDDKHEHYEKIVKLGDTILNRVHKLSRVTDL
jgi:26S proteasome regulatory subunit N7